jgi:hypothetical protein
MGCLRKHFGYRFVKYKIYKPIRNFLCYYGYGYHLPEDELIERKRKWLNDLREANGERRRGL